MKHSRIRACLAFVPALLVLGLGIAAAPLAGQVSVQDGLAHGDPPFLLEAGWTPLLNGKNLDGWKLQSPDRGGWGTAAAVIWGGPANPKMLKGKPAPGDRILNTMTDLKPLPSNIHTADAFGDQELYLEFMVAQGSNSGVYLHGLYEIQIYDSFGTNPEKPGAICGTLYNYIPVNETYLGAVGPLVRAERPVGLWQTLQVWFQAPRFDAAGQKTAKAKFLRVLLNGVLIQENVERDGPTQAAMKIPEAARNPLMLQGDHTQIAYRNIYVRPLRPLVK